MTNDLGTRQTSRALLRIFQDQPSVTKDKFVDVMKDTKDITEDSARDFLFTMKRDGLVSEFKDIKEGLFMVTLHPHIYQLIKILQEGGL